MLLALAWITVSSTAVLGHDPRHRQFDLVAFDPPPPAPDFTLSTLSATVARLSDFRGRHVLLNFWATWCPPCIEEMPALQALYERLGPDDFVVVAVSSDAEGEAVVGPFADRLGLTFPILLDRDAAVSAAYGAKSLPASFLLDPQGRVVAAARGERDWASRRAFSYFDELIE